MPENLYRRGKTWYARVEIAGNEYRRSLRTTSKQVAKARRDKWIEDMTGAVLFGDAPGYKEAVVQWATEFLPGSVKPRTAERYLTSLGSLGAHFEEMNIAEISKASVAGFISARRKAVTNATVRRDLTALSSILRFAISQGWRNDNPAKEFDRSIVRERRDPITPPTDEDVTRMIAECPPGFGRVVAFLSQTGMRQEEAAGLEWSQVDMKTRQVTLTKTKTNRPRTIELNAEALGTISGTPPYINSPYVFWHGNGERYRNFASRFRELAKRAGVSFRCHDLRHKFAIDWLKDGGDIYALSRYLGHTSVKTTEIYLDHARTNPGTGATVYRAQSGRKQGKIGK